MLHMALFHVHFCEPTEAVSEIIIGLTFTFASLVFVVNVAKCLKVF